MWQTVFGAIAAVALASQTPSFSIGGVIRYDGEPVPGVTVTVTGAHGARTVTGSAGEYQVSGLPEGPYRVSAALAGFRDQSRDVVLTRDFTIDFELEPGSEYVVFLHRAGGLFQSIAGRSLMFPVENGSIRTNGSDELPARMTVAEFFAAVRRLAR